MLAELKELWKFRELLFTMVQRDLKIRYKNSALGFLWSLLNPLITVFVMTVIFQNVMGNNTPNLSAYILAAYLPYMFFQLCLLDSAQTILINIELIKKIYFPREILPLASAISNFIHFSLALLVFFAFLLVNWVIHPGIFPFHATIVYLPILMLVTFCICVGLSFIISAANTFYEDVKYIVAVGLYLLFFLCPIMYSNEQVFWSVANQKDPIWYKLYNLNPVAVMCTSYRKVILDPQNVDVGGTMRQAIGLSWKHVGFSTVLAIAIMIFGYWMFNRLKWKFVERP